MFWIGLIVIIAIIGYALGEYYLGEGLFYAFIGTVICASIAGLFITLGNGISYPTDCSYEESGRTTVCIKELSGDRYFESASGSDGISVYVTQEDGSYKKETYNEDLVTFITNDTSTATITIVEEKPTSIISLGGISVEDFKKFCCIDFTDVTRIKEVIISTPGNDTDNRNNQETQDKNAETDEKFFCISCGSEMEIDWEYCSKCGNQKK